MMTVPLRAVVIPVVLVSVGLLWEYAPSRKAPPAPPHDRLDLLPNPEAVPDPVVPPGEPLPVSRPEAVTIDIVPELQAIGKRAMKTITPPGEGLLLAIAPCVRPTAKERAALQTKLAAWIDHSYPGERADASEGLALEVGCKDPDGLVVAAHVDRGTKERRTLSRWWILRITDTTAVLAERTSSATDTWMEWAQEGSLDVLALADLDGDGTRDVLYTKTEHEGGATTSDWDVIARLATGERQVLASHGVLDVIPQDGHAVLALGGGYDHLMYRCIERDLQLSTCPAAVAVHHHQDVFELAEKYAGIRADGLSDREQLADELAQLGVAKADRTRLAAAVPAPTPVQRAQRHVTAFVAKLDADDDLAAIQGRPHAAAETYFANLRGQLGDTPCPPAKISTADRARIDAWIAAQPLAKKATRQAVAISPVCGAYAWAGWDEFSARGGRQIHHEVLLALDADLTRVLAIQAEADGDPSTNDTNHQDQFFRHGTTVVGAVQHDGRLDVIANKKVVGHRAGTHEPYMFDPRWADASDDLVVDPAARAWFHATPTGLERIDAEPLAAHEARRDALELIRSTPPSPTPAFLHALGVLGAEPALVREVRGLSAA